MSYPDNNPKTQFGLKKTPLHLVPPALDLGAAEAFANGAEKYGPFNWREKKISATVYYAAVMRHLKDWYDRVDKNDSAPDSKVHHIKHAVACLGMILDVKDNPALFNDDRPPSRFPAEDVPFLTNGKLVVGSLIRSKSNHKRQGIAVAQNVSAPEHWIIEDPSGWTMGQHVADWDGDHVIGKNYWALAESDIEVLS